MVFSAGFDCLSDDHHRRLFDRFGHGARMGARYAGVVVRHACTAGGNFIGENYSVSGRWDVGLNALFARRAIFVSCADFGFDGNYFILQCVVYVGSFGVGFTDFVCDEKSVFSQPDGAHRELYAGDDALGLYV